MCCGKHNLRNVPGTDADYPPHPQPKKGMADREGFFKEPCFAKEQEFHMIHFPGGGRHFRWREQQNL